MILTGERLSATAATALSPTPSIDEASVDVHVPREVVVPAHGYEVVYALEELDMPDHVVASITGRSSHMRDGVTMPGGFVDPGFHDRFALEFFNHSDEAFVIEEGEAGGRLTFMELSGRVGIEPRFWSRVDIGHPMGCWEWQGGLNTPDGYGEFNSPEGWSRLAHRIAWRLERGDIGDDKVLHECDNKLCVNPDHLYLGDASDNRLDEVKRGDRGDLTPQEVAEIRDKYATTDVTQGELADEYGIAQSNISRLVNKERYNL